MIKNEKRDISNILGDLLNQRIQLELLFSTGAIVTLINLPTWVNASVQTLKEQSDINMSAFVQFSEIFILAGINALIIGFTMNIFFRVLTLCYLGIDYVYPKGIDKEKLKFSDYANRKILSELGTESLIEKTERYAGFSFSFSIFLVIKLLGLGIVFLSIIGLIEILGVELFTTASKNIEELLDWLFFLSLLIVIGVFDYFVFVLGRKFDILSKLYYPIFLFFNFLSLNFLIKKQKLILHSNFGRFKTGVLIIFSMIMGIMLVRTRTFTDRFDERDFKSISENGKFVFYYRFYDDEREEGIKIRLASIPSKTIAQNFLPLFCTYSNWYDFDLETFYKPQKYISNDSLQSMEKEDMSRLEAVRQVLIIDIDDSLSYPALNWLHYKHPKTKQSGFLTYIPIKNLSEGVHRIGIKYNVQANNKFVDIKKISKFYINFLKEESK